MFSRRFVVLTALLIVFLLTVGSHLPAAGLAAVAWPGRVLANGLQVLADMASFHRVRAERERLRAQVAGLTQQLTDAQAAVQENARLRALLELKAAGGVALTAARVIGRSPWRWSQAVILDKGRRDGLRPDMPLVVPEGLVGLVVETDDRTSRAVLLTDPNFRAGVLVQRTRQEGLLTGTPGGGCEVTYLPLEADIQPDDVILTAGIGGVFAKGWLVGTVTAVREDPSRSYRIASVRPYASLSHLEEVGVALK